MTAMIHPFSPPSTPVPPVDPDADADPVFALPPAPLPPAPLPPGPAGATLMSLRGTAPRHHPTAYIAPATTLIGDIDIGPQSTVWPGAVLRADSGAIRVGARANVQDGTVVHVNYKGRGVEIGDDVTIGHMALIHACTLEAGCFIGMKACVMDDAVVEAGAMLAAGSLLTKGKRIPAGQLWAGTPAKFVRDLTEAEKANMAIPAAHYAELGQVYLAEQHGRADLPSLTVADQPVCRPAEPPAPRMTARIAAAPTGRLPANSRRTRSAAARPHRGRSARHTQQRLRATG